MTRVLFDLLGAVVVTLLWTMVGGGEYSELFRVARGVARSLVDPLAFALLVVAGIAAAEFGRTLAGFVLRDDDATVRFYAGIVDIPGLDDAPRTVTAYYNGPRADVEKAEHRFEEIGLRRVGFWRYARAKWGP